ncbi:Uncharacterized protein HZ326_9589 [Fusarium oxysporum f. sp. albedinis]|nr:Uncharacterized protein HZ326_9589 [Fusarium oxysporum f. sp. albedinis]
MLIFIHRSVTGIPQSHTRAAHHPGANQPSRQGKSKATTRPDFPVYSCFRMRDRVWRTMSWQLAERHIMPQFSAELEDF